MAKWLKTWSTNCVAVTAQQLSASTWAQGAWAEQSHLHRGHSRAFQVQKRQSLYLERLEHVDTAGEGTMSCFKYQLWLTPFQSILVPISHRVRSWTPGAKLCSSLCLACSWIDKHPAYWYPDWLCADVRFPGDLSSPSPAFVFSLVLTLQWGIEDQAQNQPLPLSKLQSTNFSSQIQ